MGLLSDSSLMASDEPYELLEGGEPAGSVELPVEWIRDDAPYRSMDFARSQIPHSGPLMVLDIFRREFDMAHAEGGLFLLTMHPRITGHRSRIGVLSDLIEHMKGAGDVRLATHADIARHRLEEAGLKRRASLA